MSKGGAGSQESQLTVRYRHDVVGGCGLAWLRASRLAPVSSFRVHLQTWRGTGFARFGMRSAALCASPGAHAPCSLFGTRKGCELGSWPRNGQEAADAYRLRRRTQFPSRGCDRHRSRRRSQVARSMARVRPQVAHPSSRLRLYSGASGSGNRLRGSWCDQRMLWVWLMLDMVWLNPLSITF